MNSATSNPVKRRRVFYIPGYDPIHPRRYRELYRKESAAQGQISGYDIGVSRKAGSSQFGWQVAAQIDGCKVDADFEVMVWGDIVKSSMNSGIIATYLLLFRTAFLYIRSGALWRLMKLRKGPVIAALYPAVMLLMQLGFAVLIAWGAGRLLGLVHPWMAWAGLAAIPLVLDWFRRNDKRFFAYYLMHDYAYSARHNGVDPPELEARKAEFVQTLTEALTQDYDEVLVVGHSSGAHLGVSVMASLIRQNLVPANGPKLGFLTLGQVVPMVSFLPGAVQLRADLQYLSTRPEITWVDVSAPGDGGSFALCDPVSVSGVATHEKRGPLVLSAAFRHTMDADKLKAMRWRFFRLHIQYLCAFDYPGDYDYFRITAGPLTLADRYRGRAPSPSRIETPASPYKDVAA